jgi:hypothetical protein
MKSLFIIMLKLNGNDYQVLSNFFRNKSTVVVGGEGEVRCDLKRRKTRY